MKLLNRHKAIPEPKPEPVGTSYLISEDDSYTGLGAQFQRQRVEKTLKPGEHKTPESGEFYTTFEAVQLGLASKPFNSDIFVDLYELEPIFHATVGRIASDVAGAAGWTLKLKDGAKENEAEKKKIEALLKHPNEEDSLRSILERLVIDRGVVGLYALEVVRNAKEEIAELHHIPAHTIWAHKDKERYCQIRRVGLETKQVWFKKFGLEKDFSSATGEEGDYSLEERANELIVVKNYYHKNDYYGAPEALSALGAILTLIGIKDYNFTFFEYYGIPPYVIILRGEYDKKTKENLKKFVQKGAASGNPHRSLVLETTKEGADIEFKPLNTNVKEISFLRYHQTLANQVLAVYSMPAYRIGINIVGSLGGSNIKESTEIYKQSVVDTLQEDIQNLITTKIIEQGLNCQSYEFDLNEMDIRDEFEQADKATKLVQSGILNPNEVRQDMAKKPYPGGDTFYVSSQLIEVGEAEEEG